MARFAAAAELDAVLFFDEADAIAFELYLPRIDQVVTEVTARSRKGSRASRTRLTGSGPSGGMLVSLRRRNSSSVSVAGERPQALSPCSLRVDSSQTIANKSPPRLGWGMLTITWFCVVRGFTGSPQSFTDTILRTRTSPVSSAINPARACASASRPRSVGTVEEMAGRQLAEGETLCVIDGLARQVEFRLSDPSILDAARRFASLGSCSLTLDSRAAGYWLL